MASSNVRQGSLELQIRQVTSSVRRLLDRTGQINAALIDQAAFAGGNFLINVLLARWMIPDQYGAFVVAYSWFLLVQNFYDATLIEPMAIYGAGRYRSQFRSYLGYVYYGHLFLSLAISLVFVGGLLLQQSMEPNLMLGALAGVAAAAPFMLLRWLTRQPFYVIGRPMWAALGGIIYFGSSVLLLSLLHMRDVSVFSSLTHACDPATWGNTCPPAASSLSPFTAFLAMGFAGLISGAAMSIFLLKPRMPRPVDRPMLGSIVSDHWNYARWSTPSRLMFWGVANVNYLVLPLIGGLSASGTLRAVGNLVMPFYMATSAVTAVLIPRFVAVYNEHGKAALDKKVRNAVRIALIGSLVYAAGVIFLGGLFTHVAYSGRFDDAVTLPLLIVMAITLPLNFLAFVLHAALRAMNQVKSSFKAEIIPTLFSLTLGVLIVISAGVFGAYVTSAIAYTLNLAIVYNVYRRFLAASGDKGAEAAVRRRDEPLTIYHVGRFKSDDANGVTKVIYTYSQMLKESAAFHVVEFSLPDAGDYHREEVDGVTVHRFSYAGRKQFRLTPRFLAWLDTVPEGAVFHMHGVFEPINYPLAYALRKRGIPYIYTPHDAYSKRSLRRRRLLKLAFVYTLERELMRYAAAVHALTPEGQKTIQKYTQSRVVLIPNAVMLPERTIDFSQRRDHISFVGRHDIYQKGIDVMLEMCSLLKETHDRPVKFILVGPSTEEEEQAIRELCVRLQLIIGRDVILAGKVDEDEKYRILCSSRLYLQLSRFEGFGISVVEALSCGVPVVITDTIPIAESVAAHHAGFVVHEPASAVRAVKNILRMDDSEYRHLCINAHQSASQLYSPTVIRQQIVEIYRDAVAPEARPEPRRDAPAPQPA